MKWHPYLRLMRFDKPVGIFLLWWPTAWALWLANQGMPSGHLLFYFLCGTVLMRAAGCVVNDIADRNIDGHVERTATRPLAAGEVSLLEAIILLVVLLSFALIILLQLPFACFYYALIALALTLIYPFCKRIFEAPQLVLGLAFSMSIPMAYAASRVAINWEVGVLWLLNTAWVIAYDTMYAMSDRAEDLRIHVKSTAILFGRYDRAVILALQCFFHAAWICLFWGNFSLQFGFFWALAVIILGYQQVLIAQRVPNQCLKAFFMSNFYGLLMWCTFII